MAMTRLEQLSRTGMTGWTIWSRVDDVQLCGTAPQKSSGLTRWMESAVATTDWLVGKGNFMRPFRSRHRREPCPPLFIITRYALVVPIGSGGGRRGAFLHTPLETRRLASIDSHGTFSSFFQECDAYDSIHRSEVKGDGERHTLVAMSHFVETEKISRRDLHRLNPRERKGTHTHKNFLSSSLLVVLV